MIQSAAQPRSRGFRPSQSIHQYKNAWRSCRPSAGGAQARSGASDLPAVAPSILSRYPQIARSHQPVRADFAASRSRQPMQSSLSKPEPVAKSPTRPRHRRHTLPAISWLGAVRPPAAATRGQAVIPAAENLHNIGHRSRSDQTRFMRMASVARPGWISSPLSTSLVCIRKEQLPAAATSIYRREAVQLPPQPSARI